MIDDGLGYQLVPWRPALEQHLGQSGCRAVASGGVLHASSTGHLTVGRSQYSFATMRGNATCRTSALNSGSRVLLFEEPPFFRRGSDVCRQNPLGSDPKILWGQIAIVVAIVLIAVWAATQWTAWRLGFQPQLGRPWFELWLGIPVYIPPAFFWWWYDYDAYAPRIFLEGGFIAASGGFISIAVAIGPPRAVSSTTSVSM